MPDPRASPVDITELIGILSNSHWWTTAALLAARLLPIAVFTPMLGGPAAPRRFRFAAGCVLSLALLPILGLTPAPAGSPPFVLLLAKELLVGGTLALAILCVFESYTAAGRLIDRARGSEDASERGPVEPSAHSPLGSALWIAAAAVFFTADGHVLVLDAITDSFAAVPLYVFPDSIVGTSRAAIPIQSVSVLLVSAFKLAAPALVIMLLVDTITAITARLARNPEITVLALSIRSAAAIAALCFSLAALFSAPARGLLANLAAWAHSLKSQGG